jgi:hypothetical protein
MNNLAKAGMGDLDKGGEGGEEGERKGEGGMKEVPFFQN